MAKSSPPSPVGVGGYEKPLWFLLRVGSNSRPLAVEDNIAGFPSNPSAYTIRPSAEGLLGEQVTDWPIFRHSGTAGVDRHIEPRVVIAGLDTNQWRPTLSSSS
jgi:hypothetical protein